MFDAVATLQQANLYPDLKRQNAFGNFKPDQRHKLVGTKIACSLVSNIIDCTLNCVSPCANRLTSRQVLTLEIFICANC